MNDKNNISIKNIRNFCIIAHIDHGKSTLSNQIIKFCTNESNNISNILDSMELEKEKGITIKSKYINLIFNWKNDKYKFNLIDTPGHSDFSYEVYKSFLICEGALLLIDASKGIQAQTLINYKKLISNNIKIIPIINKIDLKNINLNLILNDLKNVLNFEESNIIYCSAKTGFGIYNIIEKIINYIPYPKGNINESLNALIIDTWFEKYFGIISLIYIKQGILNKGNLIEITNSNYINIVNKIGIFNPYKIEINYLKCGEIGWINFPYKDILKIKSGYSINLKNNKLLNNKFEVKKISPKLYINFFPNLENEYKLLYNSIIKLGLNDSSLFYEKIYSTILGPGIKCGFLGILHFDIIKERLEREYNINFIITNSNLEYEIIDKKNKIIKIHNVNELPKFNEIIEIREPIAKCIILSKYIYLKKIINLCIKKRGNQISIINKDKYLEIIYEIPMIEIINDFYNDLKSISNGYASLNYNFSHFKKSNLILIEVLINNNKIDLLSTLSHKNSVKLIGKNIINKLIKIVSRCQFNIKIQILANNKIILKHIIKQFRKNVINKCNGGDINRKNKLINKQKIGKNKMKKNSKISLNNSLLKSILSINKK